jgi:hypothetical protein
VPYERRARRELSGDAVGIGRAVEDEDAHARNWEEHRHIVGCPCAGGRRASAKKPTLTAPARATAGFVKLSEDRGQPTELSTAVDNDARTRNRAERPRPLAGLEVGRPVIGLRCEIRAACDSLSWATELRQGVIGAAQLSLAAPRERHATALDSPLGQKRLASPRRRPAALAGCKPTGGPHPYGATLIRRNDLDPPVNRSGAESPTEGRPGERNLPA